MAFVATKAVFLTGGTKKILLTWPKKMPTHRSDHLKNLISSFLKKSRSFVAERQIKRDCFKNIVSEKILL